MNKDMKILEMILKLLKGIDIDIKEIKSSTENIDVMDNYNDKKPILIPPDIYKKICKALKSKTIGFMGIS